jgi:hypothetical protein
MRRFSSSCNYWDNDQVDDLSPGSWGYPNISYHFIMVSHNFLIEEVMVMFEKLWDSIFFHKPWFFIKHEFVYFGHVVFEERRTQLQRRMDIFGWWQFKLDMIGHNINMYIYTIYILYIACISYISYFLYIYIFYILYILYILNIYYIIIHVYILYSQSVGIGERIFGPILLKYDWKLMISKPMVVIEKVIGAKETCRIITSHCTTWF